MNEELKKHIDSSFEDLAKFLDGMDYEKALGTYWNVTHGEDDLFDGNYGYTDGGPGYFAFTVYNNGGTAELSNFVTVFDNFDTLICRDYNVR